MVHEATKTVFDHADQSLLQQLFLFHSAGKPLPQHFLDAADQEEIYPLRLLPVNSAVGSPLEDGILLRPLQHQGQTIAGDLGTQENLPHSGIFLEILHNAIQNIFKVVLTNPQGIQCFEQLPALLNFNFFQQR